MEEKPICKNCNKEFASLEALNQHNMVKHPESIKKETRPINVKKIKNWAIFIIIALGFIYLVYYGISGTIKDDESCQNLPAAEINIGGHKNLQNHIHQDLEIIINGVKQDIPSDIGLSPGIMRPVHTHDSTGEVHVEGPCKRDFTLGEFFDIWGKELNSSRIFDKTTENGTLNMFVNEVESTEFENLILREGQKIKLEYEST